MNRYRELEDKKCILEGEIDELRDEIEDLESELESVFFELESLGSFDFCEEMRRFWCAFVKWCDERCSWPVREAVELLADEATEREVTDTTVIGCVLSEWSAFRLAVVV